MVIPATPVTERPSLLDLSPFGVKQRTQHQREKAFEQARQQLDLRCSEIARQFASMGLVTERLDDTALVNPDPLAHSTCSGVPNNAWHYAGYHRAVSTWIR